MSRQALHRRVHVIELRHDCSASDAESNPIIRRKMETTVVYRLRVSQI